MCTATQGGRPQTNALPQGRLTRGAGGTRGCLCGSGVAQAFEWQCRTGSLLCATRLSAVPAVDWVSAYHLHVLTAAGQKLPVKPSGSACNRSSRSRRKSCSRSSRGGRSMSTSEQCSSPQHDNQA